MSTLPPLRPWGAERVGVRWGRPLQLSSAPAKWIPAFEGVKKSTIAWISVARPSGRPRRGLLRMRNFLHNIKALPHAEERPKGASRSTHCLASALLSLCRSIFLTASFAGKARRGGRAASIESSVALAVFAVFCSESRAIGFAPPRKPWVGVRRRGAVTTAIPLSVCCFLVYPERGSISGP